VIGAISDVLPPPAQDPVCTATSMHGVVPLPPLEGVVAGSAAHDVVPPFRGDEVVTAHPKDHVGAAGSDEDVVPWRPYQVRIRSRVTHAERP
jgi:hypothetical protein